MFSSRIAHKLRMQVKLVQAQTVAKFKKFLDWALVKVENDKQREKKKEIY